MVEELDLFDDIIEHLYDTLQIRIQELLSDIPNNEIEELWKVSYIAVTLESKSHYVIILKDSTLLCTCINIINQKMLCCHQYCILIQSDKAVFHIGFIYACWFELIPFKINVITIGTQTHTFMPLHYIDQIRSKCVYTSTIRESVNKKVLFSTTMSMAKTSVQIAIAEGTTAKLMGFLTQFNMKFRNTTGLGIEEFHNSLLHLNDEATDAKIGSSSNNYQQPLTDLNFRYNLTEISNPEYYKPKGRPSKRFKSSTEANTTIQPSVVHRTCSYCLGKGHNIHSCTKHKADKENSNI
ncbi:unnamed protein product [Rhizophagus irregularis]|uniref:SWIM-type domain-containing protein n=2 Tax=Rhizophagus irregularis TaxID=588596 RepID=A0A915ZRV1_9GLOM|nr:unnamed protein product [Rhizophagus irregularis]CAB5385472.1 unnamed protein product [Rhizophagus irregularis]